MFRLVLITLIIRILETFITKIDDVYFFTDKNFNLRSPSVNVVVPSVRKHLPTPSKGTPQNRRLNSGTHF